MPSYEYECKKCGDRFEIRRGFFDKAKEENPCPKCGSTSTSRVFSFFSGVSSGSKDCGPNFG
jgi:putative FmdB family regulatory protein